MKPREPEIKIYGPLADHDQRCAVLHGEPAVLDLQTGVFFPSWKAQEKGWHLVRAKTLIQKLALKLFYA